MRLLNNNINAILSLLLIAKPATHAFTIVHPPHGNRGTTVTTRTTASISTSTSQTQVYGSIYAPDNNENDDDELERDHMGMLKAKSTDGDAVPQASRVWDNATQKWTGGSFTPSAADNEDTTTSSADNDAAEADDDDNEALFEEQEEEESTTPPKVEIETPQVVVAEASPYDGKIPVRFINYETTNNNGPERLAFAKPGTNILKIADEAQVRIPRQCRSGLCGSCTADVKDPTWKNDDGDDTDGSRVGYQTVRTCQAGAMLPAGCDEMIIDCYRTALDGGGLSSSTGDDSINAGMKLQASMSNFEDGWENDFAPDYKTSTMERSATGGGVEVVKGTTPEYTVKEGERSAIEIDKPGWTPRIDANIAPWETIW